MRAAQLGWVLAWALAFALIFVGAGLGQTGSHPGPRFEVDFTNPGLSPQHWTLTLWRDGSGHFISERGNAPVKGIENLEAPSVDRDVRVSAEFAESVFQAAFRHSLFNEACESRMKVAFTGWKKLSYSGPEGKGSCTFNFSKDKEIEELGDRLVAVAGTIIEGARLEALLQHDPLGLDKEIEYLVEAAGDGRAQEIVAIRGILQRLADDEGVMDRVRRRARVLLARADGPAG
ncbi:MAG: hypothetical protein ABR976_22380 [Terracidiphilus sp.]|jgi:hypothetical protein